jgi:predicted enzyme related to lactoylglutathione lyase
MKRKILIVAALLTSFCMGFSFKTFVETRSTDKKVTGIGGIFFKCKEPKKVKEWYKTHLGFNTDQYGARFEWLEGTDTTKKHSLQWSPFKETTKYFAPSAKDFMINYTVDNLTGLVEQLKKDSVTIVDTMETYEYGKFIHIMDIEGNKIELYEPNYAHHAH